MTCVTAALLLCVSIAPNAGADSFRVVGYFPAWKGFSGAYSVQDIPADQLTHVIYAFARIDDTGQLVPGYPQLDFPSEDSPGQFAELRRLRSQHPHLRTLISVGGWTWSERFSDTAATQAARQAFARSAADFLKLHGFDGIDIDWEFPVSGGDSDNKHRAADKRNLTLLVRALRTQFDKTNPEWIITVATGAVPSHYRNLELRKLSETANWLNVMTYNMHGVWSQVTNFHTALHPAKSDPSADFVKANANVAAVVKAYLKAGVARRKLLVGGALYGRRYYGVRRGTDGLFAEFNRKSKKASGVPFRSIQSLRQTKGWEELWHAEAKVPWLYNASQGTAIVFDNARSLRAKAEFVRDNHLGGMMLWSLSSDDEKHTLVDAVSGTLSEPAKPAQ